MQVGQEWLFATLILCIGGGMSCYVFLAEGFEEVEAITPIDFLRRAGIDVVAVSVSAEVAKPVGAKLVGPAAAKLVVGGHGIAVAADLHISDFADDRPEALICPGGMPGAANLAANATLIELLRQAGKDVYLCAICAAPAVVFGRQGANILGERGFTCYPDFAKSVGCGDYRGGRLVRDGMLITAIGAGAAAEFSLAIIEALRGSAKAEAIRRSTMQM